MAKGRGQCEEALIFRVCAPFAGVHNWLKGDRRWSWVVSDLDIGSRSWRESLDIEYGRAVIGYFEIGLERLMEIEGKIGRAIATDTHTVLECTGSGRIGKLERSCCFRKYR